MSKATGAARSCRDVDLSSTVGWFRPTVFRWPGAAPISSPRRRQLRSVNEQLRAAAAAPPYGALRYLAAADSPTRLPPRPAVSVGFNYLGQFARHRRRCQRDLRRARIQGRCAHQAVAGVATWSRSMPWRAPGSWCSPGLTAATSTGGRRSPASPTRWWRACGAGRQRRERAGRLGCVSVPPLRPMRSPPAGPARRRPGPVRTGDRHRQALYWLKLQHGMLFLELYELESRLRRADHDPVRRPLHWPAFNGRQDLAGLHDVADVVPPGSGSARRCRLSTTAWNCRSRLSTCAVRGARPRSTWPPTGGSGSPSTARRCSAPPCFVSAPTTSASSSASTTSSSTAGASSCCSATSGSPTTPGLPAVSLTRPAGPLPHHLVWLAEQDIGAPRPTGASIRRLRRAVAAPIEPDDGDGGAEFDDCELVLLGEATAAVSKAAGRHRITLGTLAHAAWVLSVGASVGSDDVVVGVNVAGRPVELPLAEATVGLFINTIPVAPVSPTQGGRDVAARRSEQAPAFPSVRTHAAGDGAAVERGASSTALLDNILAFENYPLHGASRCAGGGGDVR